MDKSTGRIAQQIGEKAMEAGYDSIIAYPARAKASSCKSKTYVIGSKLDAVIHALLTRIFDMHGLGSLLPTILLLKKIQQWEPDIIHLHNIHGYYINYPILFRFLSKLGKPVVWTFHDCWPMTGHCVHFRSADCDRWERESCRKCPKKTAYPSSILCDRSRQNFRNKKIAFTSLRNIVIVPVSYWLGSIVNRSFMKGFPVKVIQNGIDVNTFYPRKDASKVREHFGWENKFVVLGVAVGWSNDVGWDVFLRLRESLGEDYVIAMVGVTEEQRKFLPKGITGILRTNNPEELAQIYSAADVLFNGSFQETFGLVTAEAMACGTPVIVYDSTACPEIVDNERGRVIPVGEFDKLLEAIDSLRCLSYEDREKMSAACSNYVKNHLDKNKQYQKYIDLYNSLL